MATYTNLQITSALTVDQFKSICDLAPGQLPALQNFENFVGALSGGNEAALLNFYVGAVKATGTFTFATVIATDVLNINGVSFTCVASGATGNQFNVGASDTLTAAAAAAAINASATALASGSVVATSDAEVVTITALYPGVTGNTITIDSPDVTITASGARLTGGTNGTAYTLDFD